MSTRIDTHQLRYRCLSSRADLAKGATKTNGKQWYAYFDRGSAVLAVAHTDTVQPHLRHFHEHKIAGEHYIYNAQLDDRLGCYIILDLLPALGIAVDVLLTDDEESMRSTAAHFIPTKAYNWMVSFDRAGNDVVLYQYLSPETVAPLVAAGLPKESATHGMYSDIADMDHLKIAGYNFGTGYHDHHSRLAYANLNETEAMVNLFARFYHDNAQVRIPAPDRPAYPAWQGALFGRGWEDAEEWEHGRNGTWPTDTHRPAMTTNWREELSPSSPLYEENERAEHLAQWETDPLPATSPDLSELMEWMISAGDPKHTTCPVCGLRISSCGCPCALCTERIPYKARIRNVGPVCEACADELLSSLA